jgi:hypothetical protein
MPQGGTRRWSRISKMRSAEIAKGVEIPSRLWGKPLKVQGLMTKVRAFPQAVRSPWKKASAFHVP